MNNRPTPETDDEQDHVKNAALEWDLNRLSALEYVVPAFVSRKLERERDEARENLDEEMKFHHRNHAELIQTQCKLLDMEMKCDQLQDEIKRLKVILDLIKKDVS